MRNDYVYLLYLVLLLPLVLIATPAHAQSAAFFDEPTDVIQIDGQTVIGTSMTYEAVILFPSGVGAGGYLYNEWTNFQEDKTLRAGPGFVEGYDYPVGSSLFSGVTMTPDIWHHVAFVYDGAEERLYLDGILLASRPVSTSVGDGAGMPHIGAIFRDGAIREGFIGYMESVRISDVARYDGDAFEPPLGDLDSDENTLLLLNFNEPETSETVQDESPLGATGTLGEAFDGATAPQLGASPPATNCPLAASTSDLWDVARETAITSSSGFLSGSDEEAENVFGGAHPNTEEGNAFFRDDQSQGFVHFVEWETTASATVRSFVLRAAHDHNSLQRSFEAFRLFAFDDDAAAFELLHEFEPDLPYGDGQYSNYITLCGNVPERTASRFRAEFVQHTQGTWSGPRIVELDAFNTLINVTVSMEEPLGVPAGLALHAPYPNPAREIAAVPFVLAKTGRVRLAVYDMLGREVSVLLDRSLPAGPHESVLQAGGLPNGLYVVRLTSEASTVTRTLVLVK